MWFFFCSVSLVVFSFGFSVDPLFVNEDDEDDEDEDEVDEDDEEEEEEEECICSTFSRREKENSAS